jgi:hypothetical protein
MSSLSQTFPWLPRLGEVSSTTTRKFQFWVAPRASYTSTTLGTTNLRPEQILGNIAGASFFRLTSPACRRAVGLSDAPQSNCKIA